MAYIGKKPSDVFPTSFTVTNGTVEGAFTSQGINDDATSTALTLDSSGRIGIDVTPTAQFGHSILQVGNQATLGANKALSSTGQTYLTHNLYYDTGGTLQVYNTSSANEGALLQMVDGVLKFSNSSATTGTPTAEERMRIHANGRVDVGTGSYTGSAKLTVTHVGSSVVGIRLSDETSSGTHNNIQFLRNGTQVGKIETTNQTSTAYVTSSDYRMKNNVNYSWDATTKLKQLKPAEFTWREEFDTDQTQVQGFLAHEVQSVVPEAVTGTHNEVQVWQDGEELPDGVSVGDNKLDEDGNTIPVYQGIDQSKLVPLLVKTIQELEARIAALENA